MKIDPAAGLPAGPTQLIDVDALLVAYHERRPDAAVAAQRVAFGTSGHRGNALEGSFNADHVLAISQALCEHRAQQGVSGPLFIGIDTHALSLPAFRSAMEVFAANGVEVMIAADDLPTPTPTVSHAILRHNASRPSRLADGIVITPSHNPPQSGGYKYNPPHGGPAAGETTAGIEARANSLMEAGLAGVKRIPFAQAMRSASTHRHDFMSEYVSDLEQVIDFVAIRDAGVRAGVDPLGGAGVHYWDAIAERYRIDLTVVNRRIDPQFGFMTLDWDGVIRMDPSSPYAMAGLVGMKDRFDISFACDTDHDRHGIVVPGSGLMAPNHYLAAAIAYLFAHRPEWPATTGIGKTAVSSAMIDRVAQRLGRPLVETPVGFKWFVDGLYSGGFGFAGEESAGAAFARRDGRVWTTDKDGITAGLLSAEMLARTGHNPAVAYAQLEAQHGVSYYDRIDAPATPEQKKRLAGLTPKQVGSTELAGDEVTAVLTRAPGNDAPLGGLKVVTANGWFAARPSGTEDIYKIYAESFVSEAHLARITSEAHHMVTKALKQSYTAA
ncbi:MAG: phosphoglucomutase (alpha-D-glucose-1,6-bisphosphate-dependent) [Burkholderiaceae bacterium]